MLYQFCLTLHILSVIAWAGTLLAQGFIFSLTSGESGENRSYLLSVHRKLYLAVQMPGAALSLVLGIALILIRHYNPFTNHWLLTKLLLVVLLIIIDVYTSRKIKNLQGAVESGASLSVPSGFMIAAVTVLSIGIIYMIKFKVSLAM